MIAKLIPLFCVVAAAVASLEGVDPNTLSCDPAGQIYLNLPHETDCNKFYTCAHGQQVLFTCSPGTIFDFVLQTCNWESATKCWLRNPDADIEEGSGEEGSGEVSLDWSAEEDETRYHHVSKTVAASFAPSLNCNNALEASRQLPYAGDCQRYWRCSNGVPQASFCTDGLFFNKATEQCDFEGNAKCVLDSEDELNGEYFTY